MPADLQELQQAVAAFGEALDTRSSFFSFGGRMYLVRNLLNQRMERYGMLILGVNDAELLEPLNSLKNAWDAEIAVRLDAYGNSGEDWDGLAPGLTDDRKADKLLYVRLANGEENMPDLKLTVDRRQQYREIYEFRWMLIGVYLLLIPLLILLAVYLRKRITKPITLLSDASRRIEKGELGVTVPMHGADELGQLGEAFSHMSLRLKELIDRTYKEEIELKNAQILALQSRINPHFLNNALEDINWQARIEGSETISSMVSSLSVLLNATMDRKNRRLVTLREEMEVADAYIFFVQQRFGTELTVNTQMDDLARESILPLLTVQPLLENAVEHGIAPEGGGTISIEAARAGKCLHLAIRNSSRGIGKEDRERIDAALEGKATGNHLGLANIVNRLRLIYGEQVGIRVDTEQPGETAVLLDIPQEFDAGRNAE
jgi:two-component system sensor histidine kinase YesM